MNFLVNNYIQQFKASFDFSGKTTRKEYWCFALSNAVLIVLLKIFAPYLIGLFQLLILFAGVASLVRRFRDADVSPYAILLILPVYVVPFLKSK